MPNYVIKFIETRWFLFMYIFVAEALIGFCHNKTFDLSLRITVELDKIIVKIMRNFVENMSATVI